MVSTIGYNVYIVENRELRWLKLIFGKLVGLWEGDSTHIVIDSSNSSIGINVWYHPQRKRHRYRNFCNIISVL